MFSNNLYYVKILAGHIRVRTHVMFTYIWLLFSVCLVIFLCNVYVSKCTNAWFMWCNGLRYVLNVYCNIVAVNRIRDFNEVMFAFSISTKLCLDSSYRNKESEIVEARLFTFSICQDQVYTLCAKVMKARIVQFT